MNMPLLLVIGDDIVAVGAASLRRRPDRVCVASLLCYCMSLAGAEIIFQHCGQRHNALLMLTCLLKCGSLSKRLAIEGGNRFKVAMFN